MWPTVLIVLYCLLLIAASLAGGWLPAMIRLTHTRMQLMMSLVGGLMMGVATLHMLPHAVVECNSLDYAAWSCTLGLLAMFLTIRVFHVHQHGPPQHQHQDHADHEQATCGQVEHACPAHEHDKDAVSWMGLLLGLGIHSVLDGVAVGASLVASVQHDTATGLFGAGTFLAVLMHKPLDSLSITSVMAAGNWSLRSQSIVNVAFSLICPTGALLTFFGVQGLGQWQHVAVGCALGFSAGVFLCIALADILPEIQFHRHDRFKLTATLLVGVALAFLIGLFEPEHAHHLDADGHNHDGSEQSAEEDEHHHGPDEDTDTHSDEETDHDHAEH